MNSLDGVRSAHFIGIGGIGMSAIAEILYKKGMAVSGSDLKLSEVTDRLVRGGIAVHRGHSPSFLHTPDLVVVSSAVPESNAELAAARKEGLRVLSRAQVLGLLMAEARGIGVAGTHGKTTTTSMIASVFIHAGLDPTYLIGGDMIGTGTNAGLGKGDWLIAEADEFDRSFLQLAPEIGVITSIDADHLDCYLDLDELTAAFVRFANGVRNGGQVVACTDDDRVVQAIPSIRPQVITYGLKEAAWITATELGLSPECSEFVVCAGGDSLGRLRLPRPGRHNVCNSLAAIGTCLHAGVAFEQIRDGLESFGGVRRRFERKGEEGGVAVYDDYAHHPAEIAATLEGAKAYKRRLLVVFQPHLYSRTLSLSEEFGRALLAADVAIVTDVYAAREARIKGVSGRLIVDAAKRDGHPNVHFVSGLCEASSLAVQECRPGDIVITMGAGDVGEIGEKILRTLKEEALSGICSPIP